MTLMVLPETLTGTCTGTCTRLPEATPGDFTAVPSAVAPPWAEATPVPATARPPATRVMVAAFFRFFTLGLPPCGTHRGVRRGTPCRTDHRGRGYAIRATSTRQYESQ